MQSLSVENLPEGMTVLELEKLFRPFGWVSRIDFRPGQAAVDLAWGGWLAARSLNGTVYRGRVLVVRPVREPSLRRDEHLTGHALAGDF
jgi:hypothetical protein